MINKQNLWFLTLFSLILVLSVYYITMPNDLLTSKTKTEIAEIEQKETKQQEDTEITIEESDNLTALRVSLEETRDEEKENLKKTMTSETASTEEKNNAYEQLKYLEAVEGEEEKLEKLILDNYKLNSFVQVDTNQIKVVAVSKKHDTALANNIMRTIQQEYKEKKNITVKFEK